jgi:hypothetical protein
VWHKSSSWGRHRRGNNNPCKIIVKGWVDGGSEQTIGGKAIEIEWVDL